MEQMTHEAHGQAAGPHTSTRMSGANGNHDRHAGHSVAMFRDKFWLSFALTIPVVFWSTDVQHWLRYTAPSFPGSKFIPAILGTVVFVYGGLVFIRGAWRELAAAQASGSRTQDLADRAAAILFYVAVASGAITFAYWWLLGEKEHALIRTATVLIIACPHALGLAIPLVIAISTSIGAQNGLLVKDRLALERARNLDMVIFDKTGTLTLGSPALSGVAAAPNGNESDLVSDAAAVEANSEHPLAKAIVNEAKRRNLPASQAANFEPLPGRGAQAQVNGKTVIIGGPRLLTEDKATVPTDVEKLTIQWASEGKTVLYVVAEGKLLGAFAVEDEIRPESKEAVEELHRLGIRVAMITGDSKTVADSVAKRIGIDEVAAEVLPADKASAVKRFQAGGKRVAMVGDGVNDAPALATADVGIAIGAGTDVAIESAGIVLVRSDPRDVVGAIELSRATYRKMIQNLVWATAYNLVAIPVAAGVFVHWGLDLPMSVGAVAMSLSTIIVAANAQLLRRLKLQRAAV